ncbi:MAG: hypothetical protein LBL66_09215 [Clostridiales bacterium]|jgi:hypothetical protein|nr:hypothetical protein [Clostridiales bacterium]
MMSVKNKKSLFILLFAVILVAVISAGCGKKDVKENNDGGQAGSIAISIKGSPTTIDAGQNYSINLNCTNVSESGVAFQFVTGGEYAYITGKTLYILSTAPHNTMIKFKAVSGAVNSNELAVVATNSAQVSNEEKALKKAQLESELQFLYQKLTAANNEVIRAQNEYDAAKAAYNSIPGNALTGVRQNASDRVYAAAVSLVTAKYNVDDLNRQISIKQSQISALR